MPRSGDTARTCAVRPQLTDSVSAEGFENSATGSSISKRSPDSSTGTLPGFVNHKGPRDGCRGAQHLAGPGRPGAAHRWGHWLTKGPKAGQTHFRSLRCVPMLGARTGFTTTRELIAEDLITRRTGITERSQTQVQFKWRQRSIEICKEGVFFRLYF